MPRGIPPVAVVVGETYTMVIVIMMMVMIPCRRMNNLLCLYLWLTTN